MKKPLEQGTLIARYKWYSGGVESNIFYPEDIGLSVVSVVPDLAVHPSMCVDVDWCGPTCWTDWLFTTDWDSLLPFSGRNSQVAQTCSG